MSETLKDRNIRSARRLRVAFLILMVVAPASLVALFGRQGSRLRALVDHGQTALATLTHLSGNQGRYAHYAYRVEGAEYSWSVTREEAPFAIGETFEITFLPEDPSLSRPVPSYTPVHLRAERKGGILFGLPFLLVLFFGGLAYWSHYQLKRLLRDAPGKEPVRPELVGTVLGALTLVIAVGATFDPNAEEVFAAILGPAPLGLPPAVAAGFIVLLLGLPVLPMMRHVMVLVFDRQRRGGGVQVLRALISVPEGLRRSQRIVLAWAIYFALAFGAWIGLTSMLRI